MSSAAVRRSGSGSRPRCSSAAWPPNCCQSIIKMPELQDRLARGPAVDLAQSYRYCHSVARRQAKNFYYSFLVLPPDKRNALCAVYAFMRYCDDIADSPGAPSTKRGYLEAWGNALTGAMHGDCSGSPILPAFRDTVERFAI